MKRHEVCLIDDIPDGTMKPARVAGRDIVLIRNGEEVFAMRDCCPHQGARLSEGVVSSVRTSVVVGRYFEERVGQIVRCPWHNWEFDAADGMCLHNPDGMRVASYRVEVDGGRVFVNV